MILSRLPYFRLLLLTLFSLSSIEIFGADRYWVGNNGNWNNSSNWSASSGGSGGASIPTTADDVYFDTNSFSGTGQVVTINVNASCQSMYWNSAINNPTISGSAAFSLTIAGTDFILIDAMTYNVAGFHSFTNTGNLTLSLGNIAHNFGEISFTGNSVRTITISGNGNHSIGRMAVGDNTSINFTGTGVLTIDGYFCGSDVSTDFTGSIILTDTLQTGYDNAFTVNTGTVNSYQTVLVGEIDDGSINQRYQGSNTFLGEVITAGDYQNTDRVHFYNSTFNDKVTVSAPDGRAQFRENTVMNDTLLLEANTSVRFYDVDTFNSVVICIDDVFLTLSESNSTSDWTVFNDSVYFGPDMEFRSHRDATFNAGVNFAGGDGNGTIRRFNDGGGSVTFNDRVWFNDGAGSNSSNWTFERATTFNQEVIITDNTQLHFGDGSGTTNFNDNLNIGDNNDIYFERNIACDSLVTIGNQNTILANNTCDFDELNIDDLNTISFLRNVDFNDNAVIGDTNILEFSEFGGEVDVFDNLTFGTANTITFHRRVDCGPASSGDSIYFGLRTTAEFLNTGVDNYFEDFILENESRASFRNDDNRFDNIRINDFSTMELSAGGTNTIVGDFIANETCTTPPIVRSGTGGEQALLDFTGSAPNWSNVIVQDLEVTSSNILTIDGAVNNGNLDSLDDATPGPGPPVSGATIWITNDRPGTTLYWIGSSSSGAGTNWTNASNWSTSSGGSASICIPTPKDNVVFDANSFNASGEKVLIDASFVICNNMTWTGVTAGAEIEGDISTTIFMTGNLSFDGNMTNNFEGSFEFNANDTSSRTIDPDGINFEGPLTFNYLDGNWDFANNVSANGTITIKDGNVDATDNDYTLSITGAGNDFILNNEGSYLAHDGNISIADELTMSDSSYLILFNADLTAGGALIMEDTAEVSIINGSTSFGATSNIDDGSIFTQKAGSLSIGGAFNVSDFSYVKFDTVTIDVNNNFNLNNDVALDLDSCEITVGGAMNVNNDVVGSFGGSSITINGGDFYAQDDAVVTLINGAIIVNGDQFYLDNDAQFTDTGSTFLADNDFYLRRNSVFSSFGGSISVLSDDFFLDENCMFSLENGSIDVQGDDFYLDDNSQATCSNCSISVNDDMRIENNTIFNVSNSSVIDIEDNLDLNNSTTVSVNDAQIFVGASIDFETASTFNAGTSTVTMDDDHDGVNIRTRGDNLYNLVINKPDSTDDVRILSNFSIENDLHIISGDLWDSDQGNTGPYQITGNTTGTGTLTIDADGTLYLGDNNGGDDAPTTFPTGWTSSDISLDDSSLVVYRQRLSSPAQIVSSRPDYGDLTLNNSGNTVRPKYLDGTISIAGRFFIDDDILLADSGYQITGNANPWTEFEMDDASELLLGSATSATTLPSFPARDWDQRSRINYGAGVPQNVVSISGSGNANSYGHLTISNVDASPILTDKILSGVISIRRDLDIESDANLVDNGFQITGSTVGGDLSMESNSQMTLGTTTTSTLFPTNYTSGNISLDLNSLVVYNSDQSQNISSSPTYGNIQLSSTSSVSKSLTGDTDIDGNLTIDVLNTLNASVLDYNIDLEGDWINNGDFDANSGDVTFNGSSLSLISGSTETEFYDLRISNTAADSSLKLLNRAIVTNSLLLIDGVVRTESGTELIVVNDAISSSGSNDSHINGPMLKVGDDAFQFPVGDEGIWAIIEISDLQNSPSVTDTFSAWYIRGTHPEAFWNDTDYVGNSGGMHNTSIVEYWLLDRLSGSTQPKVHLHWADNNQSYITDTADLTVAHYTGSNTWVNEGGVASGSLASGSVRTNANVTSFSPFTFGSTSGAVNPLPIELISFKATLIEDRVKITWETASEINNERFEIERSSNLIDFKVVDVLPGAGNSRELRSYYTWDDDPLPGISYYRLKQIDYNGDFSYSDIDAVNRKTEKTTTSILPNPSFDGLFWITGRIKSGTKLEVTNVLGERLFFSEVLSESEIYGLNLSYLPTGHYILILVDGAEIESHKLIKK